MRMFRTSCLAALFLLASCGNMTSHPTIAPPTDQAGASITGAAHELSRIKLEDTGLTRITPPTPCTYSLSAPSQNFTIAAGSGSVVLTTQPDCTWMTSVIGGPPGWLTTP